MVTVPAHEPFLSRRLHWMNMLKLHAGTRADEVVVTSQAGHLTWGRLDNDVSAVAAALQARGITKGDRVIILSLNRAEYITAMLAINTLGAVSVPINVRSVAKELDYFIADSGATAVFADQIGMATLRETSAHVTAIAFDEPDTDALSFAALAASGERVDEIDVDENELAMIMYTSGTTSEPKGVMLTYLNLLSQAFPIMRTAQPPGERPDVQLIVVPLFHIAAVGFLTPAFFNATRIVLAPPSALSNIAALVDLAEHEHVTSMFLVPTLWQALCSLPGIKERNLSLATLSWGAAPASHKTLALMRETFPDAYITAAFGQTEMSPVTCQLHDADSEAKMGSVGKPIGSVAAKVIDADSVEVADGQIGEIVYRGPGLMAGYWNKPDETAHVTRDGWFHSGDLVRKDEDGFIYVVDRTKDLIISGGENISSVEVENAIASHPNVADVSVIAGHDDVWGETPVAIVVPADASNPPTLDDICAFILGTLASFKKPTRLEIVDELPRNASGKLLKYKLRRDFAGPR